MRGVLTEPLRPEHIKNRPLAIRDRNWDFRSSTFIRTGSSRPINLDAIFLRTEDLKIRFFNGVDLFKLQPDTGIRKDTTDWDFCIATPG